MVADLVHDVTYTAFEGKGAYRDGKKIETSKTLLWMRQLVGLDLNTYKVKEVAAKTNRFDCENKAYPPFWRQRS